MNLSWSIDWEKKFLEFLISFSPGLSEILVGFSDHGYIEGTDVCLYNTGTQELASANPLLFIIRNVICQVYYM